MEKYGGDLGFKFVFELVICICYVTDFMTKNCMQEHLVLKGAWENDVENSPSA